ncbi:MAG: zinc ribbon domain-containing protein [Clostridia bacterium]
MKKCEKCGYEIDDNSRFCMNCGNMVSNNAVESFDLNNESKIESKTPQNLDAVEAVKSTESGKENVTNEGKKPNEYNPQPNIKVENSDEFSIINMLRKIFISKFMLALVILSGISCGMNILMSQNLDIVGVLLFIGLLLLHLSAKSTSGLKSSGLSVIKAIPIINIVGISFGILVSVFVFVVASFANAIVPFFIVILIILLLGAELYFNIIKLKCVNSIRQTVKTNRPNTSFLTITAVFEFIEGAFMALNTLSMLIMSIVFSSFKPMIMQYIIQIIKEALPSGLSDVVITFAVTFVNTMFTFSFIIIGIMASVKILMSIGILKIKKANEENSVKSSKVSK